MSNDKLREAFESWAITSAWMGLSGECLEFIDGGYVNCEVQAAWLGWQASREALAVESPEDFTHGGNPNARILIAHHREIVGRWVKSIEAAGVRVKS